MHIDARILVRTSEPERAALAEAMDVAGDESAKLTLHLIRSASRARSEATRLRQRKSIISSRIADLRF